MSLFFIADAITWSALVLSLVSAAVLSVLAYVRPRRTYVWFAAGTLGIAMLAAASANEPAQFGLAMMFKHTCMP